MLYLSYSMILQIMGYLALKFRVSGDRAINISNVNSLVLIHKSISLFCRCRKQKKNNKKTKKKNKNVSQTL